MRGQIFKPLLSLMITVLLLASLLTTFIWYTLENNSVQPKRLLSQKKTGPPTSASCKDCREKINKVLEQYSEAWKKQEERYQKFRLQLNTKCHGLEKAIITQANTPVGTKLVYDGEKKRTLQVNPEIFSTFFKGHPFPNKTWHTCAVVGNGGILANSSCGKTIDSAEFVIRCNLPPLSNGYEKHVGIKTDLVTANPSILVENKKQSFTSCQDDSRVQAKKLLSEKKTGPPRSASCKDCREKINKVLEQYSEAWKKQEERYQKFRLQLNTKCHGLEKAIITQANTPVGTKLVCDGENKTLQVNPEIFSTFFKGHPFPNKTWHTCAVVGNGGILANSSCGKTIDSAEFVIRCNLPPLSNGYEKHVGIKTDLVTANPSILMEKFGALMGRRRKFVESLHSYGDSLLLLPAFSYLHNIAVSLRAFYTLEDFESPIQPIFFNPGYLHNLALFWRSQGLRAMRLSTGFMMASLALELCDNVQLYGFWPFDFHPYSFQTLTNHYYDDKKFMMNVHAMSDEFNHLLRFHNQGVLKLHLGDCKAEPN
ncbi:alpha-2,8-sialyltransferase 8F-like isoform X2 [Poeciliopsis prolifica]|uniref:alpha-2,8-sialyltransferase 8F-like isoform X2 n=1 Tax=Poeciliopsis prolifica TaxID=188132 RepID=UPI0024130ED8|nr:alpha-2,8-sialyltransferase 8F-like isoform X2 [Poeciliopsis prolifica]